MTYVTHHEDIHPTSVRKYSLVICQAVAMVLRNHLRSLPICASYNFKPPADIRDAAQALIEAFSAAEPLPASAEVGDDDASDATLCDVMDDVFDDDEFYVPEVDSHQDAQAETPSLPPPPSCPIIQPRLRALIRALYCQLPPPGTMASAFDSALVKFLVMASRLASGEWRTSSGITQLIAALTFGGRLAMYDLMAIGIGDASSLNE